MKRCTQFKHDGGFTLVELIVSAGIIALVVSVLVGVLRKGTEISFTSVHRQRARAIIDSCFENPDYQSGNYANIPARSGGVVIDPRTPNSLMGTLIITVANGSPISPQTGQTTVEYKVVTMSVSWAELQNQETVSLVKYIAKLDL
jgi:type II secretory pathway pseudopilin PulG